MRRHGGEQEDVSKNNDDHPGETSPSFPSRREEPFAATRRRTSLDRQFEEFLQQEADNAAFAAYHHHYNHNQDEEEQGQPVNIDDVIHVDDQTVVSEITTFTSASLFRGPLYQRPMAAMDTIGPADLDDEEIANLFNRSTTTSGRNSSHHGGRSTTSTEEAIGGSSSSSSPSAHYKQPRNNPAATAIIQNKHQQQQQQQQQQEFDIIKKNNNGNNKHEKKRSSSSSSSNVLEEEKSSTILLQGGYGGGGGGGGTDIGVLPCLNEDEEEIFEDKDDDDNTNKKISSQKQQDKKQQQQSPSPNNNDRRSYDNRGRILKSSFLSMAKRRMPSRMQQPGAYFSSGEALLPIPDYSSTLGLTSSRQEEDPIRLQATATVSTTTTNTTMTKSKSKNKNNNGSKESTMGEEEEVPNCCCCRGRWFSSNQQPRPIIACASVTLLIVVVVVVLAIVFFAVVPQNEDNNNSQAQEVGLEENQQQQQEISGEKYYDDVVPNLTQTTIQAIEEDKFSPQFQAYDWVSRDPNWDTYEDWRKQQRFALVCIYYSIVPLGLHVFQSPIVPSYYTHECDDWIRGGISYCNNNNNNKEDEEDGDNNNHGNNNRGEEGEVITLFTMKGGGDAFDLIPDAKVPPQIGYLSGLKSFVLDNFSLRTTLDEFLPRETLESFPTNIQEISFRSSRLEGSIPSTLGLLTSLTSLNLESSSKKTAQQQQQQYSSSSSSGAMNRLTSTIPTELGLLSNLRHLYLSGNMLSGSIPKELGRQQLPSLINFQVKDNPDLDPPVPIGFCDDDDDGDDRLVPFESLQTDWCDNLLDCCKDAS